MVGVLRWNKGQQEIPKGCITSEDHRNYSITIMEKFCLNCYKKRKNKVQKLERKKKQKKVNIKKLKKIKY